MQDIRISLKFRDGRGVKCNLGDSIGVEIKHR